MTLAIDDLTEVRLPFPGPEGSASPRQDEQLEPDFPFAIAVDRLMIKASMFRTALNTAIKGLTPLEELPHDQALEPSQLPHGIHHNQVLSRIFSASRTANDAVHNLKNTVAELEGVLKGPDRDRFHEPARRNLQQAEKLAYRLRELVERAQAETPDRVFAVRAQIVAGLALQAGEIQEAIKQTLERHNDSFPEFLEALAEFGKAYSRLHITFTKLRDNPSRKCLDKLIDSKETAKTLSESLELLKYMAHPIPQFRPSHLT